MLICITMCNIYHHNNEKCASIQHFKIYFNLLQLYSWKVPFTCPSLTCISCISDNILVILLTYFLFYNLFFVVSAE
jgi:hypothetical protein